ncbi:MAG: hypothetical protein EU549_02425 [Promethearchaeota archaeon]|nr:MAG: hypothetical protein EU549_02425 [Candidatus Lokiarchaeota archaeon]
MINAHQNVKNIGEMKEYLETRHMGLGFTELSKSIIDKGLCNMCGACFSICPRISMNSIKPKLVDYDPECSMCLKYCPRTYFPEDLFKETLFNGQNKSDFYLGSYREGYTATSGNKAIQGRGQNGGVVTTLLIYALKHGIIDGALLTDKDEDWKPIPVIAKTAEDIKKYAGSKYTIAPTIETYREALEMHKLKKIAFVGMPCQINAVRKLQLFSPFPDHYGTFKLVIGLFCSSNFSYDLIDEYLRKTLQIPPKNIAKMDISKGKFILSLKDGKTIRIPIREITQYKWSSCEHCNDYTAEFADISIGSIGAADDNWNTVLTRTDRGQSLLNNAIDDNWILKNENIELSKIKKAAARKKAKKRKINQEALKSLNLFGLPESASEIYSIIASTGGTISDILSNIKKNAGKGEVSRLLGLLEERGWIYRHNGIIKAYNPDKVITTEINKLKQNLEHQIAKIKSEALNYLKETFLQNNYSDIKLDELMDLI